MQMRQHFFDGFLRMQSPIEIRMVTYHVGGIHTYIHTYVYNAETIKIFGNLGVAKPNDMSQNSKYQAKRKK